MNMRGGTSSRPLLVEIDIRARVEWIVLWLSTSRGTEMESRMWWTDGAASLDNRHGRQRMAIVGGWRGGYGGQAFVEYSVRKVRKSRGRSNMYNIRPFHFHSANSEF